MKRGQNSWESSNDLQRLPHWPEGRLQVPRVTHELPPIHCGVVDALLFVLLRGAAVVLRRGALLARPGGKQARSEKSWWQEGEKDTMETLNKKDKQQGEEWINFLQSWRSPPPLEFSS